MRHSLVESALALTRVRLAQTLRAGAEEWKPLSTDATGSAAAPAMYYPPDELERQRENRRLATERAAAYIAFELEKAEKRRERRPRRQ